MAAWWRAAFAIQRTYATLMPQSPPHVTSPQPDRLIAHQALPVFDSSDLAPPDSTWHLLEKHPRIDF